jgi:hypothetical protein
VGQSGGGGGGNLAAERIIPFVGVEVAPIPAERQPPPSLPRLARAKIQRERERVRESAPPASIASLYVSERAPGIILLQLGSLHICLYGCGARCLLQQPVLARRRTHSHAGVQFYIWIGNGNGTECAFDCVIGERAAPGAGPALANRIYFILMCELGGFCDSVSNVSPMVSRLPGLVRQSALGPVPGKEAD